MSVRINCPDCDAPNTIGDDKRGRKVRCRECEASFLVPAGKGRYDDDNDDEDDRPVRKRLRRPAQKGSGSSTMLLAVGGVAVVLLLCLIGVGGVGAVFYYRSKPAAAAQPAAPAQADNPAGQANNPPVAIKNNPAEEIGRHVEPAGRFSYVPPPGWQTRPWPGSKYKIAAGFPANGFAPNINVVEERFNGTLDAYVKGNITALQAMMKNFRIVRQDAFQTTAGLPGARLISEDEQNGLRLRQTFYFFGRGNTKFVVTCTALADGGAALDPTFETSMKTFRFD